MTPSPIKFEFDNRPYTVHVSAHGSVAIQKFHQKSKGNPTSINLRWYGAWDSVKGRLLGSLAPLEVIKKVEQVLQDFYGHKERKARTEETSG